MVTITLQYFRINPDVPSTVTLATVSATPDEFSAKHLYSPSMSIDIFFTVSTAVSSV